MIPPNIALLAWPLVAIWLFKTLPFERAIIWSVLGAYLFLPSNFAIDPPGLPALDKQSLPNLALVLIILSVRKFQLLPTEPISKFLIILLVVSAIATVLTNQDPVWIANRVLPGVTLYDALSTVVRTLLTILPFLVGWQYLASTKTHEEILKVFVVAGVAYSLLVLFEWRMSPQLHHWVYGYFPSSFAQAMRGGGFRPVVFLNHGLPLAFLMFVVCICAAGLSRHTKWLGDTSHRSWYLAIAAYILVVIVLCKSLGSLIFALFCLPLVLLLSPRTHILIAAVLATIALTYPALRGADLIPTASLLETAESIDADRASSLRTRFRNEERLLEHAEDRPIFGWAGWGRNRVYDAESGEDITITDGYWIIIIGVSGWVGYLATFGLLCLPPLALWVRTRRRSAASLSPATGALCLLYGVNLIDLLPNSSLLSWTWLIGGALLGHALQNAEVDTSGLSQQKAAQPLPKTVM